MIKKGVGVSLLFLFIFSLVLVSALGAEDVGAGFENLENQVDNVSGQVEHWQDVVENPDEIRTSFLSKEWKAIILKNKIMNAIFNEETGYLKRGDIVFMILFGQNYAFSLTLLFVIIIWFYFLRQYGLIFSSYSTFSESTSSIIAFSLTIVTAQLKFFSWMADKFFKLFFYKEGIWGWLLPLIIFFGLIMLGIEHTIIAKMIKVQREKRKEERAKAQTDLDRSIIHSTAEALRGVFTEHKGKAISIVAIIVILILAILGILIFA